MKLTYINPAGTSIEFSRDAVDYKVLKRYTGLAEIPVTFQTSKSPYQHGETLLPGGTLMDPREVSFDILIQALEYEPGTVPENIPTNSTSVFDDAVFDDMIFDNGDSEVSDPIIDPTNYSSNLDLLQHRISTLASALSPLDGPGTLYYEREDGTQYRLICSPNNPSNFLDPSEKGRSDIHQDATLNFIAHDPFWYSGTPLLAPFSTSGTSFFPFRIPWSIHRQSATRQSLLNDGDVATVIDATVWGPVTDPVLTNITTGEYLSIDLELLAGDRFDITTGKNRISALYTPVSTGIPVKATGYITLGSIFWLLQKGTNDVSYSCSTSEVGSGASIRWSNKYAGVF